MSKRDNLETFKPWKQAVALVKAVDEFAPMVPHSEQYAIANPLHHTAILLVSDMANAAGRGGKDADFDYRYGRGHLFTIKSLILLSQELGYVKHASAILVQIEGLRRLIDTKLDELEAEHEEAEK